MDAHQRPTVADPPNLCRTRAPKTKRPSGLGRASSCLKEGENSGLVNGLAKDVAYFFFLPAFFFAGAFFFAFFAVAIETSL